MIYPEEIQSDNMDAWRYISKSALNYEAMARIFKRNGMPKKNLRDLPVYLQQSVFEERMKELKTEIELLTDPDWDYPASDFPHFTGFIPSIEQRSLV